MQDFVAESFVRLRHRAAEIIERKGWWQGTYWGPQGQVCCLQALHDAAEELDPQQIWSNNAIIRWKPWEGFNISKWNDHPERTREEVLELLRR